MGLWPSSDGFIVQFESRTVRAGKLRVQGTPTEQRKAFTIVGGFFPSDISKCCEQWKVIYQSDQKAGTFANVQKQHKKSNATWKRVLRKYIENIEQNFLVLWARVLGFHDGSTVKNPPTKQEPQETWI